MHSFSLFSCSRLVSMSMGTDWADASSGSYKLVWSDDVLFLLVYDNAEEPQQGHTKQSHSSQSPRALPAAQRNTERCSAVEKSIHFVIVRFLLSAVHHSTLVIIAYCCVRPLIPLWLQLTLESICCGAEKQQNTRSNRSSKEVHHALINYLMNLSKSVEKHARAAAVWGAPGSWTQVWKSTLIHKCHSCHAGAQNEEPPVRQMFVFCTVLMCTSISFLFTNKIRCCCSECIKTFPNTRGDSFNVGKFPFPII